MTRLLLAEDEPSIQLIARLSLKRAGFDVTVAGNGTDALAKAQALLPDVVLLDWMMPEMDGLEVCRHLKADERTRQIPVIFLTARSQQSELQQGVREGAIGYITKPFDALTLGQQVRALITPSEG